MPIGIYKHKNKKDYPNQEFPRGFRKENQFGTLHKGYKQTKKHKKHLSESLTGLKKPPRSIEYRKRLSKIQSGEKGNNWRGGITLENKKIRNSIELHLWREANFARDNFTCQKCKERGGELRCHHIQNFAQFPELRFAINNGITLCEKCHKLFHKKYNIRNNTKEQLEEFLTKH